MPDRGDPDRWHRLSDLFHQALECDPDRRDLLDTPTHLAAGGQSNGAPGNALHTLNQMRRAEAIQPCEMRLCRCWPSMSSRTV